MTKQDVLPRIRLYKVSNSDCHKSKESYLWNDVDHPSDTIISFPNSQLAGARLFRVIVLEFWVVEYEIGYLLFLRVPSLVEAPIL